MSKSEGLKIGIKFTEDLVGDISENESAFKATGQEYKYIGGPLMGKEYVVDKVERYPSTPIYKEDFITGNLNNIVINNNGFIELGVVE